MLRFTLNRTALYTAICTALLFCVIAAGSAGSPRAADSFFGVRPAATAEPFYPAGTLDINVLPFVWEVPSGSSSTWRWGLSAFLRQGQDAGRLSSAGGFVAWKWYGGSHYSGFFAGPMLGLTTSPIEQMRTATGAVAAGYAFDVGDGWRLMAEAEAGVSRLSAAPLNFPTQDTSLAHQGVYVVIGAW